MAISAGPTNRPRKPSDRNPPKTPTITSVSGICMPLPISQGRRMLSLPDTRISPQSAMKMAQACLVRPVEVPGRRRPR